jgi:hypothetical protein
LFCSKKIRVNYKVSFILIILIMGFYLISVLLNFFCYFNKKGCELYKFFWIFNHSEGL